MKIISNTIKAIDKVAASFQMKDFFLLFVRAFAAKIFYQSGRTKASVVDDDPVLEASEVASSLKGVADETTINSLTATLTSDEGYYVSEVVEKLNELNVSEAIISKFEASFVPSFFDHVIAFFTVNDLTISLFADEYGIDSELMAQLALIGETVLPIMVLLGIGARFGALGLLGMTAVIQIFVYPAQFADHATWVAALLPILLFGAGKVSFDRLVSNKFT